jgi:hypothetical protein
MASLRPPRKSKAAQIRRFRAGGIRWCAYLNGEATTDLAASAPSSGGRQVERVVGGTDQIAHGVMDAIEVRIGCQCLIGECSRLAEQ